MSAYVIGNGLSRKNIDLCKLEGSTYGCNALYKEYTPTVLVATDDPISTEIQRSGYAKFNRFYTRKVYAATGALQLREQYQKWSSGPNALQLAILDEHEDIVVIGFDFGSKDKRYNNIYAGNKFYDNNESYHGNWMHQVYGIIKRNPNVTFHFLVGIETCLSYKKILTLENVNLINDINGLTC